MKNFALCLGNIANNNDSPSAVMFRAPEKSFVFAFVSELILIIT